MVDQARDMAKHTLDALDTTEGPIVVPSGSCAEMIVHHYPELFEGTAREEQAARVAERTREFSQFLVDDLEAGLRAACGGCSIAFHYSCHGLRGLGLDHQADELIDDDDRVELVGDKECCGFGGLFSVEMPAVSAAIMNDKLDKVEASNAEVLVGSDVSCLLHLEGGLRRRGSSVAVKHVAELLAGDQP